MEELRRYKLSYRQIAKVCELSISSVQYHLDPTQREKSLTRQNKRNKTPKVKEYDIQRRKSPETKKWMREYMKDRYQNDHEFRVKMIRANSGGKFADG